jgi:hypothetical protein
MYMDRINLKSKCKKSETKLSVRGTLEIFNLFNVQSVRLYPKPVGKMGPDHSAARLMLLAGRDKLLESPEFIKGKRVRPSNEFINQLFERIS